MSAIIKPCSLEHHQPSASTTHPLPCVPLQTVSSTYSQNASNPGNFLIFYRTSKTIPSKTYPGTSSKWDIIHGHSFSLSTSGEILYTGQYRALESTVEREWNPFFFRRLCSGGSRSKSTTTTNPTTLLHRLTDPTVGTYRIALFGSGNHTTWDSTLNLMGGFGSWARLIDEPGRAYRSTHVVNMQLPELVAQMIAKGVRPEEVPGFLLPGEFGTVKLVAPLVGGWKGPERGERCAPVEEWKEGWWWTERGGMEVWVC